MKIRSMARKVLVGASLALVLMACMTVSSGRSIWVMRHGKDDGSKERKLSEEGREQAAKSAQKFVKMKGVLIWTSPKRRCVETAQIVHKLVPGSKLQTVKWLDHEVDLPKDWQKRLPKGAVNLIMVTHRPVVKKMLEEVNDKPAGDLGPASVHLLQLPEK
jgi:phosphohistidine phosphatase SixA